MRIRSLTLKNFRGFEDATVDLDRPLTVLCGVNGSGKSSVLDAIAIVLSQVRAEDRPDVYGRQVKETDVRIGSKDLRLLATLAEGVVTQEIIVPHPGPAPRTPRRGDPVLVGVGPVITIFYESTGDIAVLRDTPATENDHDPLKLDWFSASHDSLRVGRPKFPALFQWFKAREDIENELKVAQQNLSLKDHQLSAVRRAVAGMLPGFSELRMQRDPLHMVIRKGETMLLVDQLSDGERLLLALTADLARRLAIAYAAGADPLQGEAVVLIDEIELHLHPDWQRRVLTDLRRTFPNCQLVVTTHSPQVLSEVPNDAVTLVQDFQFFRPAALTEGRDTNAILWEVLGVPARPQKIVEEIDDISSLLDDGKHDEVRRRLDALAQALTERDPDVARLRSLLDVVERVDASDHEGA